MVPHPGRRRLQILLAVVITLGLLFLIPSKVTLPSLTITNASSGALRRVQFEVLRGQVPEELQEKDASLADGITVLTDIPREATKTSSYRPAGEFAAGLIIESSSGAREQYVIGYTQSADLEVVISDGHVTYQETGFLSIQSGGEAGRIGPATLAQLPQDRLWNDRDVSDEKNLPSDGEVDTAANATEYTLQNYIQTIELLIRGYTKTALELAPCTEATGWYAGSDLRKLDCSTGGETWRETRTLYFVEGRLLGSALDREQIDGTYGSQYRRVRSRTQEASTYFHGEADVSDATTIELLSALRTSLADPSRAHATAAAPL